jgi:hypothetical protein
MIDEWTEPQHLYVYDYGVVGDSKTISLADGNNLMLTTSKGIQLEITATGFQEGQTGIIQITKQRYEPVLFDERVFGGENKPDLTSNAVFIIPYMSHDYGIELGKAIKEEGE